MLEEILDTPECPIDWGDVQGLAQAATEEAMTLGAIVGASLAVTWPQRPQDLDGWLDRAHEVTGLAIDEAGIKPGYLATEISKQGGWGTSR